MIKAYERQPCDGNESWHAFKIYRDLGAARSIRLVSRTLYEQTDRKEFLKENAIYTFRCASLNRWVKENDWHNRCSVYDDDISTMSYRALAKLEKDRLTKTVEKLRDRITFATAQANDFAALSMEVSINEMHKVKDQSDSNDEPSQHLSKIHLDIVRTVKDTTHIIDKAANWIDRAYSLTSLMELSDRTI